MPPYGAGNRQQRGRVKQVKGDARYVGDLHSESPQALLKKMGSYAVLRGDLHLWLGFVESVPYYLFEGHDKLEAEAERANG